MSPRDDDTHDKFDASDAAEEDTSPDALGARRRRLAGGLGAAAAVADEMLRLEVRELGMRLAKLEGRMTTMVSRVIELMVSDQDDNEVLQAVRKDLAETRAEVKKIVDWLEEDAAIQEDTR